MEPFVVVHNVPGNRDIEGRLPSAGVEAGELGARGEIGVELGEKERARSRSVRLQSANFGAILKSCTYLDLADVLQFGGDQRGHAVGNRVAD